MMETAPKRWDCGSIDKMHQDVETNDLLEGGEGLFDRQGRWRTDSNNIVPRHMIDPVREQQRNREAAARNGW